MSASSKIPPHIARELRRHVAKGSRSPAGASGASSSADNARFSVTTVLAGCLGLLGISLSMPYLATLWVGHLTDKEEPLSAAQIRRGAFNNSGSRDAGKDPKWEKGQYRKDKNYRDFFERDDPNKLEHGEEYIKRQF